MGSQVLGLTSFLVASLICSSCSVIGPGTSTWQTQSPHYAYVSDNNGYVWKCLLDKTTGALSSCATEAGIPSGDLVADYSGLTLNSVGGNTYAYVPNVQYNNVPVEKCVVDSDTGEFASCSQTANDANYGWTPNGITLNSTGGATYAYVADGANIKNSNDSYVWQCLMNSTTGALSQCAITPTDGTLPADADRYEQITLNSTVGNTYAYVPDLDAGLIWQCLVSSATGALSACAKTPTDNSLTDSGSTSTYSGIVFLNLGGINSAYVVDSSGYIWQCSVSSTTGALSGCSQTPTDGTLPVAAFSYSGLTFENLDGGVSAYIADSSGNIWQCPVNPVSGTLSGCAQNNGGAGASGWSPDSISFR